jgi:hypothetical protein
VFAEDVNVKFVIAPVATVVGVNVVDEFENVTTLELAPPGLKNISLVATVVI